MAGGAVRTDSPQRSAHQELDVQFNAEKSQFHGPAIWTTATKYRKLDFTGSDEQHLSIAVTNGWIAALQHHFVTAVVPPKDSSSPSAEC